ncbi:hypothetical protein HN903_00685 [archaeon]|nr:hypothetical protein [archaeon]MBT7128248.1 hypothetical protein [archaeon]
MKEDLDCPICEKQVFSGAGEGCKMCGMTMDEGDELFCCEICEDKWGSINSRVED